MRHNPEIIKFFYLGPLVFSFFIFIFSDNLLAEVSPKKVETPSLNTLVDKGKVSDLTSNYQESDFKPEYQSESYSWLLVKTILVLLLFLIFFFYLFKLLIKKNNLDAIRSDLGQVLAIIPLGHNKYIQFLEMGDKVLVLGITETNINLLTEIKEAEEIARIKKFKSLPPITGYRLFDFLKSRSKKGV